MADEGMEPQMCALWSPGLVHSVSTLLARPVKTDTGWAIIVECEPIAPMHNPMNRWLVKQLTRILGDGFVLHLVDGKENDGETHKQAA